jgi:hypothetical protein
MSCKRMTAPTIASLGIRVRLIPVDPERERTVADLIASLETLQAEWARLFQQLIALLPEDGGRIRDTDRPPSPSDP